MKNYELLLSLSDASVSYSGVNGDKLVWSDVRLDIRKQEWIVVAGANGCGKSTLARVLLGICPLNRGSIRYEGPCSIRGVLQQPDAQFVGETIEEEFEYLPRAQQLTTEALRAYCKQSLSAVGLDVPPTRKLSRLSGGQKQLVNIALALAAQPDILVLDEPTAMIDPAGRDAILQAVERARKQGAAIVWISHRLDEIANADRVFVVADGHVAFDGSPLSFYYGDLAQRHEDGVSSDPSPCLRLSMELPYVVQIGMELLRRGYALNPLPLHEKDLAKAVSSLCR